MPAQALQALLLGGERELKCVLPGRTSYSSAVVPLPGESLLQHGECVTLVAELHEVLAWPVRADPPLQLARH